MFQRLGGKLSRISQNCFFLNLRRSYDITIHHWTIFSTRDVEPLTHYRELKISVLP